MITINLFEKAGSFAENKDLARDIRKNEIIPALKKDQNVVLDFDNVEATTQSFIHALISDLIRTYGHEVLDRISFKSCNETTQKIIMIVSDYMQESD
ncbi:MAG: STAS-like domain-containing protein [Actinomycetota bacterium]|nr:STAS-like domain-containing protein [Actinomycetota bacterium]